MKLTVVGCSGTYPTAEVPCSGYLFQSEGFNLLVDLGPGTFVALQRHVPIDQIGAILLTHWHPDHVVDIFPLYYALRFADRFEGTIPLYAPRGAERSIFGLLSGDSRQEFTRVFDLRQIEGGQKLEIGPFSVETASTNHPVETVAVLVGEGDNAVAYSADTGPGGAFPDLASRAKIVVCEATYALPGQGPPIHLSSREAAELAVRTGASRLVLTHRFPACDENLWYEEAKQVYDGPLEAAHPGMVLEA